MTIVGILIFFVGLLFSIAWHELGHYLAARRFGIKVPQFMVGFGRTIWSRQVGETEFGVKAVPFGGYIRMIGMLPPAPGETYGRSRRTGVFQSMIDDARAASASEVRPEDAHRQFYQRKPWQRVVVMFAGPFMNLVLAVVLFAIVLMGFGTTVVTTTVREVSACVVPATAATDVCPPGAPLTPAAAAGFRPGDRIVAFDGARYDEWQELQRAIRTASGTVTVTVERDGRELDLRPTLITTQLIDLDDPDRERVVEGSFLGLAPVAENQRLGVGGVVEEIGDIIARTGEAVVALPSKIPGLFGAVFLGEERGLDSPIGVVGASRIGGEVLAQDLPPAQEIALFINLLAGVNVSLFLFNLLPIPPLDGGQMFPAIWEGAKKRIARLRGRPDPGPVDAARLLPVSYVVALVFVSWFALILVADVINPVKLF